MKILILGINYAPEPVGTGPYSAGMAGALAKAGHQVEVVTAKPYYPEWKRSRGFEGLGYRRSVEDGVSITRCPLYVPGNPTGLRRLLHHSSFAAAAAPELLRRARRLRPDVVLVVAPSLISFPVGRAAARAVGAKLWLHIQDFEVEAAFATGLLSPDSMFGRAARRFEKSCLDADRVSTISPQMCLKLREKGVPADRVTEFRNWADVDRIRPATAESPYRSEWKIDREHVALYSGNIANKQGIELIVEAAHRLASRRDLMFVVCGNGANRARLMAAADGLDNIRFFDLQPVQRLSDLLGLATVHLLPQIAEAADLVLPSKLTNMLASGRPVVATAPADTGLAHEVEGCGLTTEPGDAAAFTDAITHILDNPDMHRRFGEEARRRAEDRWSKDNILGRFEQALRACVAEVSPETSWEELGLRSPLR